MRKLEADDSSHFIGECLLYMKRHYSFTELQLKILYKVLITSNSWTMKNSRQLSKALIAAIARKDQDLSTKESLTFSRKLEQFRVEYEEQLGKSDYEYGRATDGEYPWGFEKNSPTGVKFWLGHQHSSVIASKLVARFQSVGYSSSIAVALFVEYNLILNDLSFSGHIDVLATFLLKARSTADYYENLIKLAQGMAVEDPMTFLETISGMHDFVYLYAEWDFPEVCQKLMEYLRTKPILLTSFKVYEDIFDPKSRSFFDFPSSCRQRDESSGSHCMIIIGARVVEEKDGKKKYYFLLQNFWEFRAFVEVSGEYLRKCCAMGITLRREISSIPPESVVLNNFSVAETVDGSSSADIPYLKYKFPELLMAEDEYEEQGVLSRMSSF
jgi:hypothetical protein